MIYHAKDLKVGLFKHEPSARRRLSGARSAARDARCATTMRMRRVMRRVVVTGMGIVSSIGNNTQEVLASLREAKSGIVRADEYAELGFRCQVHGAPTLDPEEVVDRRAMRFHGGGTAWNHVAMEQAIRDAGLEESDISNERTGIIMGSGGPSTRAIVEAADTARSKGPKRVGPFAVPKAMSSTASATLATWFKIKGVNYSISSACATSNHCIGNAVEIDPARQAGHGLRRRLRGARLDAVGPVRRHGRDVVEVQRDAGEGLARLRRRTATASSSPAAPACWCWKSSSTPRRAARASTPRSSATARPPTATTWSRPRARARCAACSMALDDVKAPIDYINPHATSTPVGDLKEIEAIREVFGGKCPPISATKSLTGHSLGAAGVQEAIYSLLMMNNGFICESANIENLDPEFADMPIVRERRDNVTLGRVLTNSFGFGGTNASVVFKRLDA